MTRKERASRTADLRVLHLITRLDPGGSAESTLLTCHHLARHAWQTALASGPGWTGEDASVGGIHVPVLAVPSLRRDPSPVADVRALWQIYRLVRRHRPTVLHTHSAKAGVLGRWAGRLARVPVIVHTPHGHVLYGYAGGVANRAYRLAERASALLTDCLVALSEGERRESIAAGIGKPEQWVVIPSGVDVLGLAERSRDLAAGAPLRIGCVARLEHVKGVDVLVRAAARLGNLEPPAHEVLVWGEGRDRGALIALQRSSGADSVRFVGTGQPVEEFLRGLDVYVQPSRNEGMGRALVLAQGVGLPVVASRVCGIPDVVRDGETGELVAPDDPEALAAALARMLRDSSRRIAFGNAAREWIMKADETGFPAFSTEAVLLRLEHLYRRLAGVG